MLTTANNSDGNIIHPTSSNESTKEKHQIKSNKPLIYSYYYILIYYMLSIPLNGQRSKWSRIAITFIIIKLSFNIMYEIHFEITSIHKYQVLMFISMLALQAFPLIDIFLLHRMSYGGQINKLICTFQNEILSSSNFHMIQTVIRTSKLIVLIIAIQWFNTFLYAYFGIEESSNWIYERTVPIPGLNNIIRTILLVIVFAYESLFTSYIGISVGFYICLFQCFMIYKKCMLNRLENTSLKSREFSLHLNEINDAILSYESIVTILPFNWMVYSMIDGSFFLLSVILEGLDANGIVAKGAGLPLTIVYCAFLIVVVISTLFYISYVQEIFVDSVIITMRKIEIEAATAEHLLLLDRMKELLTKPVSVWTICPINRSLILTYIGSCISFSTVFMQVQSQGLK